MRTGTAIALGVFALLALPVGCAAYGTWTKASTAPSRVVNKTLDTDNIITNYEAFFDVKASYDGRVRQIVEQEKFVNAETDPAERARLRTEVSAMRQSCRELANRYNADAAKLNRGVFKANSLPEMLSAEACDA